METVYFAFIIFLFMLAIFDLVVGVSNDAVNFLNSAIGAKVARFKVILWVAAIGVFMGAVLSNGMMDIARHGIFQPSMFSFYDLLCIFLAVMVTDVVLLDVFNSLGMPTSTTVSLVFELLGGTFLLALIKIVSDSTGTLGFAQLLNTDKALAVILGIFLSVAIAFVFGFVVQWLSRLVFTFNYRPRLKWAMGSSLADRAWTRESAVFRITGVLNVIGGWFITAGVAFSACALVALFMYFGGMVVMFAFVLLAVFILVRNNLKSRRRQLIGMRRIDSQLLLEKNTWFHLGSNSGDQMIYCLKRMAEPCYEHVDNNFNPLPQECIDELLPIQQQMLDFVRRSERVVAERDFPAIDALLKEEEEYKDHISAVRHSRYDRMHTDVHSGLNVQLVYLNILQETQQLLSELRHYIRAFKRFQG